jgi:Tfp pilus assembly protein PilO
MQKNLGLLGVGILIGVVGLPITSYLMVFKPTNKEIAKAREEVKHMEGLLSKLKEESAKRTDFEKANQQLADGIKVIEERLPTNQEIDSIVRQVSDLAVNSGLAPPAIKSNKPLPAGLYMEQPLDMETQGDFIGFHSFLAQVEKMPRVTRIHNLKITGNQVSGPELKATFTLSIYFQEGGKVASAQ